jgi:tetratricopeptide (TPR) repeat protein
MDSTMPNAILLKIKILSAQRALTKVLTFAQQLIEKHPNNIQILHVYQLLKNMGVPINQLIQAGIAVLTKKSSTLLLATVADLCVEAKDLANADKLYGTIIKQSKNPLIKARARYQICYLLFHCGQDDQLEKKLISTLNDDVVDPGIYNLLAYHYGTHNKKLDVALSYIEKALISKPDYAPFLDTKAYVLLKLGKKEDAHKILELAHRQAPNDKIVQQRFIALQSML